MDQYFKFKTLLGHKNLNFSIECLQSFVHHSKDEIRLQIFDDGTLTNEDKLLLNSLLKNSSIVDLEECTKIVNEKLENFPLCKQYRNKVVYSRKIFDLMLYSEEDCYYIDSDIFFLKNYQLPSFDRTPVMMFDSQNAYSFNPTEFRQIKEPIFTYINSGFFFFPYEKFDLNFVEELLSRKIYNDGFVRVPGWSEQTIWAFLASRSGKMNYFDKHQVAMAEKLLSINAQTICVHLVSTYRYHFEEIKKIKQSFSKNKSEFILIKLFPGTKYLKNHHFFQQRLAKRIKRIFVK